VSTLRSAMGGSSAALPNEPSRPMAGRAGSACNLSRHPPAPQSAYKSASGYRIQRSLITGGGGADPFACAPSQAHRGASCPNLAVGSMRPHPGPGSSRNLRPNLREMKTPRTPRGQVQPVGTPDVDILQSSQI